MSVLVTDKITHHAVSSMKMPSLSSCINSSPPAVNTYKVRHTFALYRKQNTHPMPGTHSDFQTYKKMEYIYDNSMTKCRQPCVGYGVTLLTAQILQDKVELSPRLEGIDEVHNERVLHLLQNVPLSFSVRRVLCITHNHCLVGDSKVQDVRNYSGKIFSPISYCQSFNIGCRVRAKNQDTR